MGSNPVVAQVGRKNLCSIISEAFADIIAIFWNLKNNFILASGLEFKHEWSTEQNIDYLNDQN